MTGNEANVIAERKQIFPNGANQRGVIAVWKVGAPNRALKEDVADEREALLEMHEHHMSGRVPRTVPHLESIVADADRIALFEPTIWSEDFSMLELIATPGVRQLIDPILI